MYMLAVAVVCVCNTYAVALQVAVTSKQWNWRKASIHYEVAAPSSTSGPETASPILLLPGFGVGTFHFERNLPQLAQKLQRKIFALDLLGQGKSWPTEAPTAADSLCYSVDTWRDQIIDFLVHEVQEPAYLAGNSLGGYLSVCVAARNPQLCKGLILLNATPFWGFNDPLKPWLWNGTLPPPEPLFRIGAAYFDTMRNPATVQRMLSAVYSNAAAVNPELVQDIIAATQRGPTAQSYGVGGHEAFTSILFAPKAEISFDALLEQASHACPIALLYGREDPWVTPLWGQSVKHTVPAADYYEISPSGHCVHHETSTAVNELLSGWIQSIESGSPVPLADGTALEVTDAVTGAVSRAMLMDGSPRTPIEWLASLTRKRKVSTVTAA